MNKLSKILLGVCLCLLVIIFILLTQLRINSKNQKEEQDSYDVSMMHSVDTDDILEMFSSKKTYIVYIGREECETCNHIIDTLEEAQIENNYITQYLDITTVDFSSDSFTTLVDKLNLETSYKLSDTDEEINDTYGNFLKNYGLTPMLLIIKKGKLVNGYIGNTDKDYLINLITEEINN